MKKFWLASLMAAILCSVFVNVALAQSAAEDEVPFCGDLTETDCARLQAIPIHMAELTSGTRQNQVRIFGRWETTNLPELSLTASSEFTFVIDPDDLTRMIELQMMSPTALAADPDALQEAMRLPSLVDRAQTITLELSPDLIQDLADNFNLTVPTPFTFQVRVIDQVLYIRLADFAFLGTQPDWVPEWLGIEFRHMLNSSIQARLAEPEFGEDDIVAIQSALIPPGTQLAGNSLYYIAPDELAAYADFMSLTARGMQEIDGTLVMLYATEWDIPRYVGGPLFAEQMGATEHPSANSRLYASFATVFLDGLSTTSQQSVGVNDSLLHSIETNLVWAMGLPGGTPRLERPTIGIEISHHNRDLNGVEAIPVPTGVFSPPLNLIFAIINLFQS